MRIKNDISIHIDIIVLKENILHIPYKYLDRKLIFFLLQCNRLLRWCPYPDCNYAIKVQYPDPRPVVCKCQNVFCFYCGENWYDPVKCHLLKRWIKKCDDDSETSNWIAANTKVRILWLNSQDYYY